MASRSTKSDLISTASRVGVAWIMLADVRYIEAMHTHGMSRSFVYKNLHKIVEAICETPALVLYV